MLFPAVYDLGFRAGHVFHGLILRYQAAATSEQVAQLFPRWDEVVEFVRSFPLVYKEWWLNLVMKDPLHVCVETTLLITIVYLFASRSNEGFVSPYGKLTKAEKEELLAEWKESNRASLAPSPTDQEDEFANVQNGDLYSSASSSSTVHPPEVLVHKHHGRYMEISIQNSDAFVTSSPLDSPRSEGNSKDLAPSSTTDGNDNSKNDLLSVLNFATFDFLGMQSSSNSETTNKLKEVSEEALKKYGCGSCGPRGFYGTIDTHLQLEDEISKFTNTDGAIMYSDGASTCSSTVAAFAKRGDVLVVDEGCYEPLVTGVMLSRANVKWFKHNDMDDLERVLKEIQKNDEALRRPPNAQRRFIVVEGLYKNLGTICRLEEIVALKHKYHYRLILDESFSFGTLGKSGKGVLELNNLRHMYDAEVVTIGLENSLGSIGGVTVGNEEVVDHQRLSGAGYCFSASAPPFTASAAVQSLQLMQDEPQVLEKLHSNIAYVNESLRKRLSEATSTDNNANSDTVMLVVTSDEKSPIVVLQLEHEVEDEADILSHIVWECLQRGVAVVAVGQDTVANGHLRTELAPAIRMTVSSLHNSEDMDKAISALIESARLVTARYPSCRRRVLRRHQGKKEEGKDSEY